MKLTVDKLIKYAYSMLPESEIEQIEKLFEKDEYEAEFEIVNNIINKALQTKFTYNQMVNWVNTSSNYATGHFNKKAPSTPNISKAKFLLNDLKQWFDQTFIPQQITPAFRGNTAETSQHLNINNKQVQVNLKQYAPSVKFKILIVDATKKILFDEVIMAGQIHEINYDKPLHPGHYCCVLSGQPIGKIKQYFTIDNQLNPFNVNNG